MGSPGRWRGTGRTRRKRTSAPKLAPVRSFDLAVVGVGNMGVSVLGAFLTKGFRCLALDIDVQKISAMSQGRPLVPEQGADAIFADAVRSGRLAASTRLERVAEAAVVFIGVQTPAHGDHCDYSAIQRALRDLA